MGHLFADRSEAGRLLARRLVPMKLVDPVVLALPRGGVPVAAEVAAALQAPLDLLLVRKIGVPGQPELAIAAVAEQGEIVMDSRTLDMMGIGRSYIERAAQEELREIARRRALYLQGRPPLPVEGRTAIVVDDGIATGTTVRAALRSLRRRKPARLVLAVPVAPPDVIPELRAEVDDLVCLSQPPLFHAVGLHYDDFHQVADDEVIRILAQARPGSASVPAR